MQCEHGYNAHAYGSTEWVRCWEHQREEKRKGDTIAITLIVIIALIIFAGSIVHAVIVYGDWTCAIAECRKVFNGD